MIPQQERAVDPHSSYLSSNVNKLTRIVTDGEGKICRDNHLFVSFLGTTEVLISKGIAVKDDVMLQFPYDMTLDLTDGDNYIIEDLNEDRQMDGPFDPYDVGYIVLSYQYEEKPDPNFASIKILKHIDNFNTDYYIFLAALEFDSPVTIHPLGVLQSHNGNIRPVANLTENYTDQKARDAQALNPISNHLPVMPNDRNKVMITDPNTGLVNFERKQNFGYYHEVIKYSSDYDANNILTITHNLDKYPDVKVIDLNSKELILEGQLTYISRNEFTLSFSTGNPTPDVIITYC